MGLLSHVLTYLSGVVSMPLLERLFGSAFAELRQHWQSVAAGRHLVRQPLDPLLKAADELHGKLRSLAEEDFREFKDIPNADLSDPQLVDLCSTLYLFAQFINAILKILQQAVLRECRPSVTPVASYPASHRGGCGAALVASTGRLRGAAPA